MGGEQLIILMQIDAFVNGYFMAQSNPWSDFQSKLVRSHQSFYVLQHDLNKNLNANVKDDKAMKGFCLCCV